MHVLILGGTTEANALAHLLAGHPQLKATLSLAGRTKDPILPPIPHRIGGFGGPEGLAAWLRDMRVSAIVDATHPFAKVMPFHAYHAASETNIPLLALTRPPWEPREGDRWTELDDHAQALAALTGNRRIFLTVGRIELPAYAIAPQHFYLVRSIDPVEPKPFPDAHWLTARGPFTVESEQALLVEHRIDTLITKNSGGSATGAKLAAARARGLPVILIRRPAKPDVERVETAQGALKWLTRIHALSS